MERLKYIKSKYLEMYKTKQPITLSKHFAKIKNINLSNEHFDYYISNSAVYSSMIEGNQIDFDSYLKYSHSGMNNKGKSYTEIEDLKSAYRYAKNNILSFDNLLVIHKILSATLIDEQKYRGKIRDKEVYIFKGGVKIYTGANTKIVKAELEKLFEDISILLKRNLSMGEVFYFASMIHLAIAHIHPFADGNGRASRLMEKWFLSQKLGENAWFIQSERLYQKRIQSYYKNINIGPDYEHINYDISIPFLLMLPMSLRLN